MHIGKIDDEMRNVIQEICMALVGMALVGMVLRSLAHSFLST